MASRCPKLSCDALFFLCSFLFSLPSLVEAATIQYEGRLFAHDESVAGGYVIAGTFAPGFDPYNNGQYGGTRYNCVYGDGDCNLISGAYDAAVSDGNFLPIGIGAVTGASGEFSAIGMTGMTDAAEGTPLWLFAFADEMRDTSIQVLASSGGWQVPTQPDGAVLMSAGDADLFVMGAAHPEGVSLSSVPIPEPSTGWMLAVAVLTGARLRRRQVD